MQQEIRTMLAHGGEGEHAAVVGVDAPALSGDVAAPDEADVAPVARCRAKTPDHGFACDIDVGEIAKADAVKDVLPGRQIFQQQFCGEIAFG